MPDETLPPPDEQPPVPALAPSEPIEATEPAPAETAAPTESSTEAAAPAEPPPAAAPAIPELSPAACGALLAQHFPALFGPGVMLPIKLRIQADIQARVPGVFTRKSMSLFLHRHTTSTAYLKALVASPQRFDLDGAPAGEVAAEHRDAAAAEVERRRGIVQARRAAERQAQRPPAATAGEAAADPALRPPRPPRPPSGDRPPRPPRPEGERPARRQDGRAPGRPEGRPDPRRGDRGPADRPRHARPPAPQQAARPPRPERSEAAADAPLPPGLSPAEIEARRDRAALLRAYEGSTLTKANFCVLKRISEAELDARLVQARQERDARPPRPRPVP